jgi:hypothetical protein
MPDDFYDRDILDWAEQQAALLRRVAAGERVNAFVDWPHVIEEIEDLGRAELHACEGYLRQAMVHLLKLSTGADEPAAHWRAETLGFLAEAAARFTPAMRARIDLAALYVRARRQALAAAEGVGAIPAACPWALDELLSDAAEIEALVSAVVLAP